MPISAPTVTLYLNRSTGRWHANVYWADTGVRMRPSLRVPAEEDPAAAFEAFKREILPGLVEQQNVRQSAAESVSRQPGPLVADLVAWYTETHLPYTGAAPKTIQKYRQTLRDFAEWCRARKTTRIDQLGMRGIQEYLAWADERYGKRTAKTQHGIVAIIRAWLNACVDADLLERSPIRRWFLPRVPAPAPKALSRAQVGALLEVCREEDPAAWPICQFIAWTGFRPSDACDLRWGQVQRDRISRTQLKNGARVEIPITAPLREALDAAGPRRDDEEVVFRNTKNDPWTVHTIYKRFRAVGQMAGMTVHLKLLRTSYASALARARCNPKLHMRLMGHTRLETTLAYYTEVDFEMAADFLEEFTAVSLPDPSVTR